MLGKEAVYPFKSGGANLEADSVAALFLINLKRKEREKKECRNQKVKMEMVKRGLNGN